MEEPTPEQEKLWRKKDKEHFDKHRKHDDCFKENQPDNLVRCLNETNNLLSCICEELRQINTFLRWNNGEE